MNKTKIAGTLGVSAVLALALFFVAIPNTAHADDWSSGGDYTSGDIGGGWTSGGDFTSSGTCCDFSEPAYYDYSGTPSYYDEGGSYSGGYSYGGGFTGGWSFGGGYGGGSSYSPSYSSVNQNYCTYGSCNSSTTISNINTTTNTTTYTASQPVVYTQPSYPVYYAQPTYTYAYNDVCANLSGVQSVVPTGYTLQNGNCNYVPTYTQQPYVTLAAVPYTGLELGFWGTIAYWGFLVLWCLIAAYLIAVKKIQNKVAAWFAGNATQNSASQKSSDLPSSGALRATPAGQTFVKHNSASLFSGIDSFVLSQINRAK